MELYGMMLARDFLEYFRIEKAVDVERVLNDRCYQALCRIRKILADDSLEDRECFQRTEETVCVFEDLGSDAGNRYDFG